MKADNFVKIEAYIIASGKFGVHLEKCFTAREYPMYRIVSVAPLLL